MNEITKPISVERVEFINSISKIINESNLPAYVIEPILTAALRDVRALERKQYEIDLESYKKAMGIRKDSDMEQED